MMGIGQVVTLEIPACKLHDVNVALEKIAWKALRRSSILPGEITNRRYPDNDGPKIANLLRCPAKRFGAEHSR